MNTTLFELTEADLRRKTDRQLVLLARRELARAAECAGSRDLAEARARYSSARALLAAAQCRSEESTELTVQLEAVRASISHAGSAAVAQS